MDRREFLRKIGTPALSAAAGSLLLPSPTRAEKGEAPWLAEPRGPYAPFRMALQSYSLRTLDFQAAIDAIYDLELGLVELWPGHFPLDSSEMQTRLRFKAMRYNMLRRIAYGVVEFTRDRIKNRDVFEFAQKLHVYALTANPHPESFTSLDRLVEKTEIAVAIHNHGPEDGRYGKPELIEKAIRGHHERIGLCVDTGHFLRAGVDPVDVVKRFKERIYAVHLKDVTCGNGKSKSAILGQGDLDLVAFLRALKKTEFRGGLALEYEDAPQNFLPTIRKCLAAVREAVKEL